MNYLVLECFDSLTFGIREGMFTILTWLITIFSWGAELEIGTEMLPPCPRPGDQGERARRAHLGTLVKSRHR